VRSAGGEIYGHAVQSTVERNAGVAITGDAIVAAHSLKLVEGAEIADIGTGNAEISRDVSIGEVGSANRFD
jgi:tRNA A58 N-methylase Trm61